jgi:hypothetical protein
MQRRSLKRLRDYRFTVMLAGHGGSIGFPHERMQAELASCLVEIDKLGWEQLTHLPNGVPVPDEWKDIWANDVPRAKTDFFAAVGTA